MKVIKALVFLFVAVTFLNYWGKHRRAKRGLEATATAAASVEPDANGFISCPHINNPAPGKVVIIAPLNCPKEAGRRADAMERSLLSGGIPCLRTDEMGFSGTDENEAAQLNKVATGPLPIILIRDRVKNNPDVSQVFAEYHNPGRK
jgi:hypothetical protein